MLRRAIAILVCTWTIGSLLPDSQALGQERAYGRVWGGQYNLRDWERFYHYPYIFYPQNFWGNEYYRSSEDLYHRYPPEMRVPVYNQQWHNFYPQTARYWETRSGSPHVHNRLRYHSGHHFLLDVF